MLGLSTCGEMELEASRAVCSLSFRARISSPLFDELVCCSHTSFEFNDDEETECQNSFRDEAREAPQDKICDYMRVSYLSLACVDCFADVCPLGCFVG